MAAHDLPQLAMSHPARAVDAARAVLQASRDAVERSFALHAMGIAARDAGDLHTSARHLRTALRLAESAGNPERAADVGATLGTTLAFLGNADQSIRTLDAALASAGGLQRARVLLRRGGALLILGRLPEAIADFTSSARALHRNGDALWEARAVYNRAAALLELGEIGRAIRDLRRSADIYRHDGSDWEAALSLHNLGFALYCAGDIPAAIARLDEAERIYAEVDAEMPELATSRCVVLSAAALAPEARAAAERAVSALTRHRVGGTRLGHVLLTAADAASAAGDPEAAARYARRAESAYRRSNHAAGTAQAQLAALRTLLTRKRLDGRHVRRAASVVTAMHEIRSPELAEAELVAGRVALLARDRDAAAPWLDDAAGARGRGPALRRATGWLAAALRAQLDHDSTKVLRAADRGLAVLDEHSASLGATELRAAATTHGEELAALALETVARHGTARDLLAWTERWRSTLHAGESVHPPDDPDVVAQLAALRQLVRRIATEGSTPELERERARHEDAVRRRTLAWRGTGATRRRLHVPALLDALGEDTTLVSVVGVDGVWQLVVARRGRVRRHRAGSVEGTRREVEYARFGLRAAAVRRGRSATALFGSLEAALPRIEEALLGSALRDLGDGPVVLVPPARLQSAPWGALPSLRDRDVTVAPSATAWLRGRTTTPPRRPKVTLVAGPGLDTDAAEVPALSAAYGDARVLRGPEATAERVLAALDGASLAHVAAHGTFRGDNPMFSSLQAADGPLTVYDLERLRRAPYRLVLSACESGVGAPTGADELLGLASSLVALGTAGVLASVVPVNDEATVPFSLTVHAALRDGAGLGEALRRARRAAGDDPLARATAWAFLALGAA